MELAGSWWSKRLFTLGDETTFPPKTRTGLDEPRHKSRELQGTRNVPKGGRQSRPSGAQDAPGPSDALSDIVVQKHASVRRKGERPSKKKDDITNGIIIFVTSMLVQIYF